MSEPNATLHPEERIQFVEAFEDNLDLLLDLVEAVRSESANVDDETAAEFMTGVSQVIRAFRCSHRTEELDGAGHFGPVSTDPRLTPDSGRRALNEPSKFDIG